MKRYLIVIAGPTASGKTELGIYLAKALRTEVVSADSRQIYRHMDIGTAKPAASQLAAVNHHLIDMLEPETPFTAGAYERMCLELLATLFKTKKAVLLVGGSGLYIQAVCEGLDEFPDVDPGIRSELQRQFEENGISFLQGELREKDPESYATIDLQNPRRLIRALEVTLASGKPFSSYKLKAKKSRPFETIKVGLDVGRDALYERINKRVDRMMELGLLEEARRLLPLKNLNALQTLGYRELFDFLDGNTGLDEAVELVKRNTRRYAKRQMTWFRSDPQITWFDPSQAGQILTFIREKMGGD